MEAVQGIALPSALEPVQRVALLNAQGPVLSGVHQIAMEIVAEDVLEDVQEDVQDVQEAGLGQNRKHEFKEKYMFSSESIRSMIEEIKNGTFDFSTITDEDLEALKHQNEVISTLSRSYWSAHQLEQITKSQTLKEDNE